MPAMSTSRHVEAGDQPVEHPVEAVLLGAARTARRADHRLAAERAEHDQIAGIDRHAGADDLAAGLPDRRRDDVVEIAHRRCAEDHHHVVVAGKRGQRLGDGGFVMRRAPLGA